ncbi:MAG: hypothetical protein Q9218_005591 [Villophora microphyllina]
MASPSIGEAKNQSPTPPAPDYSAWESQRLVERVTQLEKDLRKQTARCELLSRKARSDSPISKPTRTRSTRQFDPSKYSTRFIALKFAYLGQKYNGLEYHANNNTPYPTIEEEMWKALRKAKLIFPTPTPSLKEDEPNWEGCEYSKSGRTDKGVSAFGQVIGIRVRSNRPLPKVESEAVNGEEAISSDGQEQLSGSGEETSADGATFDSIRDEIPYPQILNRLLPPNIRVLAWCPSPPADFSARFSCRERCYKYFFTQPAFSPMVAREGLSDNQILDEVSKRREGWLDIRAMSEAASKFEGLHDFRNFCKVDPSKQIDNFQRRINSSDVVEIRSSQEGPVGYLDHPEFQQFQESNNPREPNGERQSHEHSTAKAHSTPKIYAFKLQGSAFLWHQVRHIVAILFLIGQGLEKPSLVDELLDIERTPQKPTYDMADAAPLVLEDCKFPSLNLQWVHLSDYDGNEGGIAKLRGSGSGCGKYGLGGAVDELWKVWHKHKIDETLAGSLLDLTVRGGHDREAEKVDRPQNGAGSIQSQKVYLGGDAPRLMGKYVPVLERPRMESVTAINEKYRKRKGIETPKEDGQSNSALADSTE